MPKGQDEMLQKRRNSQTEQFHSAPEQEHRDRRAQSMPAQPQHLNRAVQQNENVHMLPVMENAQLQFEEQIPAREMNAQALQSASEAYRTIHVNQRMGIKDRMRHSDRAVRKKQRRVDALNAGAARYAAQEQALQQQYSLERHPEIAGREELAASVMKWMVHSDNGAGQAQNTRRFRAAMGTPEQQKQEIRRIFKEFLALDMRSLQIQTDEDLAANYDRLRDLTEKGKAIETLLGYVDQQDPTLLDKDIAGLRARIEVCRAVAEAMESKRALMNNPYYALMQAADVASLSADELLGRADAAAISGDLQMSDYLRRVRAEKLRKQQGDVLKNNASILREREKAHRDELKAQRKEEAQTIVGAYKTLDIASRVRMLRDLCLKDTNSQETFAKHEDAAYNLLQDKADVDFMRELFRQQLEAARALIAWRNALPADMDEQERSYRASHSLAAYEVNSISKFVTEVFMGNEELMEEYVKLNNNMSTEQRDVMAGGRAIANAGTDYSEKWVEKHKQLAKQISDEGAEEARRYAASLQDFDQRYVVADLSGFFEENEEQEQKQKQEQEVEYTGLRDLFRRHQMKDVPEPDYGGVEAMLHTARDQIVLTAQQHQAMRARAQAGLPQQDFTLKKALGVWLDGSDTPEAKQSNMRRTRLLAFGTDQQQYSELREVFQEFLQMDISILKYGTDEELQDNLEQKLDLAEKGAQINAMLDHVEKLGFIMPVGEAAVLRARADACETALWYMNIRIRLLTDPNYSDGALSEMEAMNDQDLNYLVTSKVVYNEISADFAKAVQQARKDAKKLDRTKSGEDLYSERIAERLQQEQHKEELRQRAARDRSGPPMDGSVQVKEDKDTQTVKVEHLTLDKALNNTADQRRIAATEAQRNLFNNAWEEVHAAPKGTYSEPYIKIIAGLKAYGDLSDNRRDIKAQGKAIQAVRQAMDLFLSDEQANAQERAIVEGYSQYLHSVTDGQLQFDRTAAGDAWQQDISANEDEALGVTSWEDVSNVPLFTHEPTIRDIKQGFLGNCYMMSAIGSAVVDNPALIKQNMRDNGDGTVTVRLYRQYKLITDTEDLKPADKALLEKEDLSGLSDGDLLCRLLCCYDEKHRKQREKAPKDVLKRMIDEALQGDAEYNDLKVKADEYKERSSEAYRRQREKQSEISAQLGPQRAIFEQEIKQELGERAKPELVKKLAQERVTAYFNSLPDSPNFYSAQRIEFENKEKELRTQIKQKEKAVQDNMKPRIEAYDALVGKKQSTSTGPFALSDIRYINADRRFAQKLAEDVRLAPVLRAMRSAAQDGHLPAEEAFKRGFEAILTELSADECSAIVRDNQAAYDILKETADKDYLDRSDEIYVTVKKQVTSSFLSKIVSSTQEHARDALWVQMYEKALAAAGLAEQDFGKWDAEKKELTFSDSDGTRKAIYDECYAAEEAKMREAGQETESEIAKKKLRDRACRQAWKKYKWLDTGGSSDLPTTAITGQKLLENVQIHGYASSDFKITREQDAKWNSFFSGFRTRFLTCTEVVYEHITNDEVSQATMNAQQYKNDPVYEAIYQQVGSQVEKQGLWDKFMAQFEFVLKGELIQRVPGNRKIAIEDVTEILTDISSWKRRKDGEEALKALKNVCADTLKKEPEQVTEQDMSAFAVQISKLFERSQDDPEIEEIVKNGGNAKLAHLEHLPAQTGRHAAGSKERLEGNYTPHAKSVYDLIEKHLKVGGTVNCGSKDYPKIEGSGSGQKGEQIVGGLAQNHAYTVVGCYEKDGFRYVTIRNPWARTSMVYEDVFHKDGTVERIARKSKNAAGGDQSRGIFNVELNDFMDRMDVLHITTKMQQKEEEGANA